MYDDALFRHRGRFFIYTLYIFSCVSFRFAKTSYTVFISEFYLFFSLHLLHSVCILSKSAAIHTAVTSTKRQTQHTAENKLAKKEGRRRKKEKKNTEKKTADLMEKVFWMDICGKCMYFDSIKQSHAHMTFICCAESYELSAVCCVCVCSFLSLSLYSTPLLHSLCAWRIRNTRILYNSHMDSDESRDDA